MSRVCWCGFLLGSFLFMKTSLDNRASAFATLLMTNNSLFGSKAMIWKDPPCSSISDIYPASEKGEMRAVGCASKNVQFRGK